MTAHSKAHSNRKDLVENKAAGRGRQDRRPAINNKRQYRFTPTLAKMFSRELVREVRALFLRISSLKRLPLAEASAPDELLTAFCQVRLMN